MRLRTTLQLASFCPIFMAALFILYVFTVHLAVAAPGGGRLGMADSVAIAMGIFALLVGWRFYRAGQSLVQQVGVLERMSDRVKRGVLEPSEGVPAGTGEVAAVAEVFSQMVVELRGYVDLIAAHERLKRDYEAEHAAAERLRKSAIQTSGALERLRRAEEGITTRLLDGDLFLLSFLPSGMLRAIFEAADAPAATRALDAAAMPPDIRETFQRLAAGRGAAAPAEDGAAPPRASVADALTDAVRLCRWKWAHERAQAPIDVTIDAGNAERVEVDGRPLDLVQAFAALLINAAEAMPGAGAIAIQLRTDADGTLNIAMADRGQGMSDAVRARCMNPFFSTKEGQLGMGLTLAGRLAARGGGRLGVIGEKDNGATVYLTFPRPSAPAGRSGRSHARTGPLNILLVDDDAAARETLEGMLSKEGHRVTAVEDGAAAVLLLRQQRFDVVMTDLAMPIMSGEELAVAVKARYPTTPVLLVSGAGEELRRQHIQPEGVDVVLAKPVLRYDLVAGLARAMERAASGASS